MEFCAVKIKTRLFVYNLAVFILILMFTLSFPVNPAIPAFGGDDSVLTPGLSTPSIYDLLWARDNLAKEVLRIGFPIMDYFETQTYDGPDSGLPSEILKVFLGFSPRNVADLILGHLPGYLDSGAVRASKGYSADLESDWGLSPVLYSIDNGTDVTAATLWTSQNPIVAVYHTHATESYLPEIGKRYPEDAFSDDMSKTVVRVGEMLVKALQERYRISCLQSRTVHDEAGRVGAYYRSEQTVKAIASKYPGCKYLIDVHRDSQRGSLTRVTIRGKQYARLMFVIGTDNPNWVSNYTVARQVVSWLEDAYPGISRGIFYQSAVYNQDASPQALLVEVGGVDNTLEECRNSMEALAWALASVILPAPPSRP